MKKLVISVVLALASTGVYAKDWKVIRFGVDASYAPFESKAPDGKLVGFDVDLGNAICEKLKAKCVWVENDFDGMIPALKAKKFDGVLSSLSVTEKRAQQIAFTDKLFNAPVRMVAKKGVNLMPSAESLRGKRVGVEQGTTQETFAKTYWEAKGVAVVPYQNQDLVLADLASGRLDATLQDAVQADIGFLKTARGRDFAFAGPTLNDPKTLGTGTAIGLRKEDNDLRQQINKAIAEIHKDGTYQRLSKKYFNFDIYN
ncbi:ABC transporter substrate-binding protein [Crenobacter cavernae]|uniref:ABC transporter substrate-binding protein n=1 Tax=Crenobacter cavernae TaxID=2290923 RepID=A0ABY0FGX3_9NEIS|nr:ABC transporter substrate-binding protein [Crenobacter cavernae]RXZ45630.1 ABC transporter substrate-binding protein [Crenobacter cavernae]